MKIKVLNIWTKLISLCLVALGFNACLKDDEPDDSMIIEYGVGPQYYSKLNVSGEIVADHTDEVKPVEGIRIIMLPNIPDEDDKKIPAYVRDTAFTDDKGKFEIKGNKEYYYYSSGKFKLKIEDVDGNKNGLFENKEELLEVDTQDYKEDPIQAVPLRLIAEKEIGTIKLKPKQEEPEK